MLAAFWPIPAELRMPADPLRIHPGEDDAERRAVEELKLLDEFCEVESIRKIAEALDGLSSAYADPGPAPQPCSHAAGSPEKIAAMGHRVAAGLLPRRRGGGQAG